MYKFKLSLVMHLYMHRSSYSFMNEKARGRSPRQRALGEDERARQDHVASHHLQVTFYKFGRCTWLQSGDGAIQQHSKQHKLSRDAKWQLCTW